jgi:hypothetical protein
MKNDDFAFRVPANPIRNDCASPMDASTLKMAATVPELVYDERLYVK